MLFIFLTTLYEGSCECVSGLEKAIQTMRICILSVIIVLVLTQSCASASEEKVEDNLVTNYPVETSSEIPIGPRLPHYEEITADDQPDHHPENTGHIRFEDDPQPQVNFENINQEHHVTAFTQSGVNTDIGNIPFDGDQNDRILTPDDQFAEEDTDRKVNFKEPLPPLLDADNVRNDGHANDSPVLENNVAQAPPLDDDEDSYEDEPDIDDEKENTEDVENTDGERPSNLKPDNAKSVKSNVTERIAFGEDSRKESQPTKRRSKGKPRVQASENTAPITHRPPFSSLGYAGYPGYPGPVNPGPGDPNSVYSGYPHVHPSPGYPGGYPGYPTPYPTSSYPTPPFAAPPYPTPAYPGYSHYPGYPGSNPGYYPYPVYQGAADQRPPANSSPPEENDQETQADTKYPTHKYPEAAPGGQPVPGRPGAYPGHDYAGAGYPIYPAQTGYPGYGGYGGYGYAIDPTGQYSQYRPYPGYQGYYGPPRRPKTLTQRAISAVVEALTSIALFDDKQCVPRLLCEVASGSTASSPTLQKATAGLGPLLAVLQSYNGVSSSPLFLFGRAAVLGMTSKDNPTSCRHAYPQCPNDPEGLINYLNNHNGGFFRFFGQPEGPNQQQNLEQFYNSLAGQYGYQQQQQSQQQPNQQQGQQQQQTYGYPHGYGMRNPYRYGNYGYNYHNEQNTFRNSKVIDSEIALSNIEERIQNKPEPEAEEDEKIEQGSKWTFPDEVSNKKKEEQPKRQRKQRAKKHERPAKGERGGGNTLKFPDDRGPVEDYPDIDREREFIRQQKGIFFPSPNHFNIQTNYPTTTPVNLEEYVYDYKHNFYVKRPKPVNNDDSQTLYVVRGNGDPNHPEIVKVRPGQSA